MIFCRCKLHTTRSGVMQILRNPASIFFDESVTKLCWQLPSESGESSSFFHPKRLYNNSVLSCYFTHQNAETGSYSQRYYFKSKV